MKKLEYPALLTQIEDSWYMAEIIDFPNLKAYGKNYDEVMDMAYDALDERLDEYFKNNKIIPEPSKIQDNYFIYYIEASIDSNRRNLHNTSIEMGISLNELAKMIGIKKTDIELYLEQDMKKDNGITGGLLGVLLFFKFIQNYKVKED